MSNPWNGNLALGGTVVNNGQNGTAKNVRSNSIITSSNLLASNYVPNHLKAINDLPVFSTFPTMPPRTMDDETRDVFFGLLGGVSGRKESFSDCHCTENYSCTEPPKSVKTTREAAFAIEQAEKRREPNSTMQPISAPLIDQDMVRYCSTFRELLQTEYAETKRLYEQAYNQYCTDITIPKALSTRNGNSNQGVAEVRIMGIADGRPSLKNGDKVLIRPIGLVPIHPFGGSKIPMQSQHAMIEVDSHVLAVNRGRGGDADSRKDQVLISWTNNNTLDRNLRSQKCNVRFIPSRQTHERCLTALDWLRSINSDVARNLLFPNEVPKLPRSKPVDENLGDYCDYEELNINQSRFVQMVLQRTSYPSKKLRPPMILTGCAGTGKTKTILAAVLQILHQGRMARKGNSRNAPRIMICTPSHTACDVITERLSNLLRELFKYDCTEKIELSKLLRNTLFRLYDSNRTIETVPPKLLPYTRQRSDGSWSLPSPQELLKFSVIVCTCEDAHLLFLAGLTNSSLRKRRNCFLSTTKDRMQSSGLFLNGTIEGANDAHFTHLFIDEAAQATEPASIIPMSIVVDDHPDVAKVEIILSGDPRQLGSDIYSPLALQGLEKSLLERLLRLPDIIYGGGQEHLLGPPGATSCTTIEEMIEYSFQKTDHLENLSVFLNLSYRGHPSFLLMPSKIFYFNKLQSAAARNEKVEKNFENNIWIRATRNIESLSYNAFPENSTSKRMDWPMLFYGVNGKCTSMAIESFFGSNCWCNHAEAEVVVQIIEKLISTRISTASIGVMGAFRAQVVLIRKLLRLKNLGNVNVGMVEDYQSMERDVIILSITRSNSELMVADVRSGEGLLQQPKRMNVALTRAENLLIVVGNPNLMKEDVSWSIWMDFCRSFGLWWGSSETSPLE